MHGAVEPAPSLVQRLQESPQRVADSMRATALWLAMVDGPLDPREFSEVGSALTHEPEGVPLHDMVDAFLADPMPRDLPRLFRFVRSQRSPKRTESLLDLFIRVAGADGRISQVERHALIFLSDLLSAPESALRERFEAVLGIEFDPPADLSDPAHFQAAEALAATRAAKTRARAGQAEVTRQNENHRADALRTLMLKADATPIAIKAAWRRLSRQHHPDRLLGVSPEVAAASTTQFHAVQQAWSALKDDADA